MDPSVRLDRNAIGRRVVVRRRLRVEGGRQRYGDVLGILESWPPGTLRVRRADGTLVEVDAHDVVAGKTVPPRPVRPGRGPGPPPAGGEELARIAAAGWPAPDTERLGDWVLRSAGGFSRRASSALAAGEPGTGGSWAAAGAAVEEFYARRGLPARAQVVVGSAAERGLTGIGWRPEPDGYGGTTVLVQVAPLGGVLAAAGSGPQPGGSDVDLRDRCTAAWFARYRDGLLSETARQVLEGPVPVVFAGIGDPPVAVCRGVVTGDWMGLNAMSVAAEHRRRGLARQLVAAVAGWAGGHGARWAYLQVASGNDPACELYARLGFRTDHAYRYLVPPAGGSRR